MLVSLPLPMLMTIWLMPGAVAAAIMRAHHIVDVDVVARLLAIAVHDQRAAAHRLAQEVRDDRRMGGGQVLTRTVGIEDPQA